MQQANAASIAQTNAGIADATKKQAEMDDAADEEAAESQEGTQAERSANDDLLRREEVS